MLEGGGGSSYDGRTHVKIENLRDIKNLHEEDFIKLKEFVDTANLAIDGFRLKYKKVSKRLKRIEKATKKILGVSTAEYPHGTRMALQEIDRYDNVKWLTKYESPIMVSLAAAITGIPEKSIYVWVDNGLIKHVTKVHAQSSSDPEPEYYPEMVYVSDVFAYAAQCGYRRNTRHKNEE